MKKENNANQAIMLYLSNYLNYHACDITTSQVKKVSKCGISEEYAYTLLLINHLNITDRHLIDEYFPHLISLLNENDYKNDAYYKNISFKKHKCKNWELKYDNYKAYELFVKDDFKYLNGKVIPSLGFFDKPFYYPAVYENKRLWMSLTPNEINTMKIPIANAKGKVITFGLGLGYYAFHVSNKKDVTSITIIEKDENVIKLFKEYLLPQFKNKDKIKIIKDDAYHYLENNFKQEKYDYCFVDIYHDAGDGKEVYLKFEKIIKGIQIDTKFEYWIYNTIRYYL